MKRLLFLIALAAAGGFAFGRDIDAKSSGSLTLKTLTEFGWDLDHPERYGLNFSVPELSLTYDLFGYQNITNKVKSDTPVGFVDLTLGEVQIRFTNGAVPDYNAPSGQAMVFGFNDSASTKTGYFGPLYLQNVRSGILWGDWLLQLGAGGTDFFWDPWHREQTGYGGLQTSWAYLDTRVQYLRPLIPKMISAPNEDFYWVYDKQTLEFTNGIDEDSLFLGGPMIGLQYNGGGFSTMFKVSTRYNWTSTSITTTQPNGIGLGWDYAVAPADLKGFRVLGSVVAGFNQFGLSTSNLVAGGTKVGYDIALPKGTSKISSVEPYVGLDLQKPLAIGGSADGPASGEASAGLTVHWPGMNGWGWDYLQGDNGRTGNVYSGLTLAYKVATADVATTTYKHSAQLTWYNDEDGGLIANSGSEIVVQFVDFAQADGNNALKVSSYFDYALKNTLGGVLIPWTKVYFDNFKLAGMPDRENNLKIDAGLKLKKAIRNAELGLTYQSRNILGAPNSTNANDGYGSYGIVKCSVQISL